jgi:hypothetical protein
MRVFCSRAGIKMRDKEVWKTKHKTKHQRKGNQDMLSRFICHIKIIRLIAFF